MFICLLASLGSARCRFVVIPVYGCLVLLCLVDAVTLSTPSQSTSLNLSTVSPPPASSMLVDDASAQTSTFSTASDSPTPLTDDGNWTTIPTQQMSLQTTAIEDTSSSRLQLTSSQDSSATGLQTTSSQDSSSSGLQTTPSQDSSPSGLQTTPSQNSSATGLQTNHSQDSSPSGLQTTPSTAVSFSSTHSDQSHFGTTSTSQVTTPTADNTRTSEVTSTENPASDTTMIPSSTPFVESTSPAPPTQPPSTSSTLLVTTTADKSASTTTEVTSTSHTYKTLTSTAASGQPGWHSTEGPMPNSRTTVSTSVGQDTHNSTLWASTTASSEPGQSSPSVSTSDLATSDVSSTTQFLTSGQTVFSRSTQFTRAHASAGSTTQDERTSSRATSPSPNTRPSTLLTTLTSTNVITAGSSSLAMTSSMTSFTTTERASITTAVGHLPAGVSHFETLVKDLQDDKQLLTIVVGVLAATLCLTVLIVLITAAVRRCGRQPTAQNFNPDHEGPPVWRDNSIQQFFRSSVFNFLDSRQSHSGSQVTTEAAALTNGAEPGATKLSSFRGQHAPVRWPEEASFQDVPLEDQTEECYPL